MKRFLRLLGIVPLSAVACVYGAPHGSYTIQGKTINSETKAQIPGIEVAFGSTVTVSDDEGNWSLDDDYGSKVNPVIAQDIDGLENGSFQTSEVFPEFTQIEEGVDALDEGVFEALDVIIELDPNIEDTGN